MRKHPEELHKYGEEAAMKEVAKMQKSIESGEAKDYIEAQQLLAKNELQGAATRLREWDSPYADDLNDAFRWGAVMEDQEIRHHMRSLSSEDGIKVSGEFLDAAAETLRRVKEGEHGGKYDSEEKRVEGRIRDWALETTTKHVDAENIKSFFGSSLEKHAAPADVLEVLGSKGMDAETTREVLRRYEDKVDLSKLDLFGKDSGVLNALDEDEKRKVLDKVVKKLEDETKRFDGSISKLDPIGIRLEHLTKAAAQGVKPSKSLEALNKLSGDVDDINPIFTMKVHRSYRESLGGAEAAMLKIGGELPEGIKGEGLEFGTSKATGLRLVYLNGEFVVAPSNAKFAHEGAANQDTVAWVVTDQIDFDRSRSSAEWMDSVYVWKKGSEEPVRVFEDHAYDAERTVSVVPPKVEADGSIVFSFLEGDDMVEKRINV